jgi:outer membrane protein OmpA-like peptidoglycan-associated protein
MGRAWKSLLILAAISLTAAGCQNAVVNENRQLRDQNRELQAQLDEAHRTPPAAPVMSATPVVNVAPTAPVTPVTPPVSVTPSSKARPDFGGIEATEDAKAGTTTLNLPSDVFFGSGQATILPEAKKSLDKVISVLKKEYAGKAVRIEGHTDSDPIVHSHWKSNQELSEKRAGAVHDYLVSKGVDASRITTVGFGDTKPKSQTDKKKNRRVELVVITR